MPVIKLETRIKADIKTCFDLSRSIDVHQESLKFSEEKAVAGKISGLIKKGEWVSWEAKHFGIVQHFTSKITELEEPYYFVGEMILGAFKSFRHEHRFSETKEGTLMTDIFYFESPYGILGKIADILFLKRYMLYLLKKRGGFLKQEAECLEEKQVTPSLVV